MSLENHPGSREHKESKVLVEKGLSTSKQASEGSSRKLKFLVRELVTNVNRLFAYFSADICMVVNDAVDIHDARGMQCERHGGEEN